MAAFVEDCLNEDWLWKQAQEIQDRDKNRKRADDCETYHDQEADYWKGSSYLDELEEKDKSVKFRSYQDMSAEWSNAPEAEEDAPKAEEEKKKHRGGRRGRAKRRRKWAKASQGNLLKTTISMRNCSANPEPP